MYLERPKLYVCVDHQSYISDVFVRRAAQQAYKCFFLAVTLYLFFEIFKKLQNLLLVPRKLMFNQSLKSPLMFP